MKKNKTPKFYIWFAIISAVLLISNIVSLIIGSLTRFVINPVYTVMFIVGFTGLLIMDILAIKQLKDKERK